MPLNFLVETSIYFGIYNIKNHVYLPKYFSAKTIKKVSPVHINQYETNKN